MGYFERSSQIIRLPLSRGRFQQRLHLEGSLGPKEQQKQPQRDNKEHQTVVVLSDEKVRRGTVR